MLTEIASEMRNKIFQLEAAMKAQPENAVHIEPKHYFVPGIYMREISIPKGTLLTGEIHLTEHLCVLSKGSVRVWTDEGMKTVTASEVVHSNPGIKRAMFALEDSVWINVHHNPTDERDVEKMEEIYVVKTFEEFVAFTEKKLIEGSK